MANIKSFDPELLETREVHRLLSSAIAPRPIAFASTIDAKGNVNLSPFSFFNVFSSNPPILIFSPARRVRDNTTKHTLQNATETKEVVINTVDFSIVEQMSETSREFDKGVNEFTETGLTEVPSVKVKPPRVMESPVSFECVVENIVSLGEHIHVKSEFLDENGQIDSEKLGLVARLGGDWYTRVTKESMFKIEKPKG